MIWVEVSGEVKVIEIIIIIIIIIIMKHKFITITF